MAWRNSARGSDSSRKWIKASRAAKEDWLHRALQANLPSKDQTELARAASLLRRLADS